MSGILNLDTDSFARILCWFGKHKPGWMAGGTPPYWRCNRCEEKVKRPKWAWKIDGGPKEEE